MTRYEREELIAARERFRKDLWRGRSGPVDPAIEFIVNRHFPPVPTDEELVEPVH